MSKSAQQFLIGRDIFSSQISKKFKLQAAKKISRRKNHSIAITSALLIIIMICSAYLSLRKPIYTYTNASLNIDQAHDVYDDLNNETHTIVTIPTLVETPTPIPTIKDPSATTKPSTKKQPTINISKISAGSRSFKDSFSSSYTLEEDSPMSASKSPNWWLNSGGELVVENGYARTMYSNAPDSSHWQVDYLGYNPIDTDNGYHPQNLFRLVTKSKWKDFTQQVYFKIDADNLSSSPHRAESNGILLFNRYVDSNNLYYAGIRVDGTVVIKKKVGGQYYLMGQKQVYSGDYSRNLMPNLLPKKTWIGIRTVLKNLDQNKLLIKVLIDQVHNGQWKEILSVVDDNKSYGGKTITNEAFAGIRTDFMDVSFDDYSIVEN